MTSVKELGGEFALIDLIARTLGKSKDKSVVAGIGDDTAVVDFDEKHYMLLTVDMLVEGDHFSRKWSTAKQIGMKAMEINVSDIAAMGGFPKYALVSISLPEYVTVEYVKEMYSGMKSIAKKHNFSIIGGNTTHGEKLVIDVVVIGLVEKERLCLRSNAKVGDLICVTGNLGKSTAGLETLKAGLKGNVKDHLEPECRLKEARIISKHANAMIDVSDGLASEVKHMCEMSQTGATVEKKKIPISRNTFNLAGKLKKDAYDFALHGGEDFELVFTIPKNKLKKIKTKCPITVVGKITSKKQGVWLVDGKLENHKTKPAKTTKQNRKQKTPLGGGYDHFKQF